MPVRSRLRVQERLRANARSLFLYRQGTSALLFPNPSHFVTAPFRVASDKETAQWAFSASSLRQQERLHRPLPMVESGVPAAATFCESLADADDAALMRLHIRLNSAVRHFPFSNTILIKISNNYNHNLIFCIFDANKKYNYGNWRL